MSNELRSLFTSNLSRSFVEIPVQDAIRMGADRSYIRVDPYTKGRIVAVVTNPLHVPAKVDLDSIVIF